jgi:hypothetical protein
MALVRAADAMLRSLGGQALSLVFPMVTFPDDPAAQLGLADPGVEEVELAPVVIRNLRAESHGTRVRFEFLVPASVVLAKVEDRNVESPESFFESALGVVHDGRLLRIETVDPEWFAGIAYLYRVTAGG